MWAASSTFRVGAYAFGVRSSTAEMDAALRAVLAAHVLDGVAAPANYSMLLAERHGRGPEPLHLLYRGHAPVVRSRSPRRLVEGLVANLGRWGARRRDDVLQVEALALVGPTGAVLAPPRLRADLARLPRRLARAGIVAADGPVVTVDPETAELVVEEPEVRVDGAALAAVDAGPGRAGDREESVAPGRYRLSGWAFVGDPGQLTRAGGVVRAAGWLWNFETLGAARALESLGRVFRKVTPAVVGGRPHVLADQLTGLARG